MAITHNLGFPRIGASRELKFALEAFWRGETTEATLTTTGKQLRRENWQRQKPLDYLSVGDFSFYDHVLDTSFLLGSVPERITSLAGNELDNYFRIARGRSAHDSACHGVHAGEMTKWFDTNYHYIVPELKATTRFQLNASHLLTQLREAQEAAQGKKAGAKPIIIGPVTYLWLSKAVDGCQPLELLDELLPVYAELLNQFANEGVEWVQIDEPILVTELTGKWQQAIEHAYNTLKSRQIKLLLTTYFGALHENLALACRLPIDGLHLDASDVTTHATTQAAKAIDLLPSDKILSLGIINGRNIWKTDLCATLDWLEPIVEKLQQRLWLAPSCSLIHVPVDLQNETTLDPEIKNWLAFATQKLDELSVLARAINQGRHSVSRLLSDNAEAIASRKRSERVHNAGVKKAVSNATAELGQRQSDYSTRALRQRQRLKLPVFPTTTIGSFPQTQDIRQCRRRFKNGEIEAPLYEQTLRCEIQRTVNEQEALGLDVLVHGEAERNDMVEYFGEQLQGYVFSEYGWVQSYGSRCVKPPILFGDISRAEPMTVKWTRFAQSLTNKPMKGMLTGPVTLLNWSFVRDDQARRETCLQLALAMREEVLDLEKADIAIIQIDEAALREGLPLRRSQWPDYLDWAINCFRICANGVADTTQIHTHMCYSEFNDIITAIAAMDADVITIETSRSAMELLDSFDNFRYPNEIGPGVYDIHSPNIPTEKQMIDLMNNAAKRIPVERLWVNPDCGLKTRQWDEVIAALHNMVNAARSLRASQID